MGEVRCLAHTPHLFVCVFFFFLRHPFCEAWDCSLFPSCLSRLVDVSGLPSPALQHFVSCRSQVLKDATHLPPFCDSAIRVLFLLLLHVAEGSISGLVSSGVFSVPHVQRRGTVPVVVHDSEAGGLF